MRENFGDRFAPLNFAPVNMDNFVIPSRSEGPAQVLRDPATFVFAVSIFKSEESAQIHGE
jgi:hypothetical protein